MNKVVRWIDWRFYGSYPDNWDNRMFREQVLSDLRSDATLLDLGSGRGALSEMDFRGHCARVFGVDPDPTVLENPFLEEARRLSPPDFAVPYPDASFDMVISNNVLEHLEAPEAFFSEVARVLKPRGMFLAKTPNRRHYVSLLAQMTPQWFHEYWNEIRGRRERKDTFPTLYRVNTPLAIRKAVDAAGLLVTDLRLVEGRPEYMRISSPTYLAGLVYERLVNAFEFLDFARCVIFVRATKLVQ